MTVTNTMQDNVVDRDALQEAYIERIVDSMDHKDLWAFVYDNMNDHLDKYSVNELIQEVEEYYPELLED